MAIIKKQEKKNEKEEKSLQAEMNARKVSLEDEQLGSVAGGTFSPRSNGNGPSGGIVETDILKKFGT